MFIITKLHRRIAPKKTRPMTDIIKLLPDAIANQIAAGEVIQRPASVVKEFLENAIDAGASEINLLITDSGKTLIQVSDNGCGMSETDARLCFERHATSKIKKTEDLFCIQTFGFRGEALASVAAVAQVSLSTKRTEDEIGTKIQIEASKIRTQEPVACNNGTTIAVKNLFFNVPARRKFLKPDSTEFKHIGEEFVRAALAQPGIGFTLVHNGNEIYNLRKSNLKQRVVAILGENTSPNLIPLQENTSIASIQGFVGKPQAARKSRSSQYFFVNNRYIKDGYLHHAVTNAYQELLTQGQQPIYAIYISVNPASIDINIHPTKTEIKFEDEKSVYSILFATIKRALAQYSVTSIDFDKDVGENVFGFESSKTNITELIERFNSKNSVPTGGFGSENRETERRNPFFMENKISQEWSKLYEIGSQSKTSEVQTEMDINPTEQKKVFQWHEKYIIATIKSGLMFIDQELAHERILYEELLAQTSNESQQNLFPETIGFSVEDAAVLQMLLPELVKIGFYIDAVDVNSFLVKATPLQINGLDTSQILQEIINENKFSTEDLSYTLRQNIAKTIARRTCLKQGKHLLETEMHHIIVRLFACKNPNYSPSGKATIATFTNEEIEAKFKLNAS